MIQRKKHKAREKQKDALKRARKGWTTHQGLKGIGAEPEFPGNEMGE